MEYHGSKALILRIKDLGESDLLVVFFTQEAGLLKGIAKGARRSRKRFVNCLDYFCLSQLEYHRKREDQLFLLDSCKLIQPFERLRTDFHLLSLASYFSEMTETLFPPSVKAEDMFDLIIRCFEWLCNGQMPLKIRILFEARAMALGGYAIDLSRCCYCKRSYKGEGVAVFIPEKGGIACLACKRQSRRYPAMGPASVKTLMQMQDPNKALELGLSLTRTAIEELKPVLDRHIIYRLGKTLKSRKYLE